VGTGEDLERLQRIAANLGIERNVSWLGEIYDEERLAPWFLKACCLLYPGAIGLTLLHAFAYGLPVVTHSSRRLHGPEIAALVDGENGLLFEKGNVEDLCSKVRGACDDAGRRRRLSECAFRTVREQYSMTAMIARFRTAVDEASRRSMLRHSAIRAA
jgi:glycosyltransferase involved in cell wall biosynthesis